MATNVTPQYMEAEAEYKKAQTAEERLTAEQRAEATALERLAAEERATEEAAAREVLEEFGVAVRLTGLVGVYSERDEPVVLVVYSGDVEAGEPRPDGHEVSEIQRFALDAQHSCRLLGEELEHWS